VPDSFVVSLLPGRFATLTAHLLNSGSFSLAPAVLEVLLVLALAAEGKSFEDPEVFRLSCVVVCLRYFLFHFLLWRCRGIIEKSQLYWWRVLFERELSLLRVSSIRGLIGGGDMPLVFLRGPIGETSTMDY